MASVLGIHHVTAIASDPQRNLDFYAGVLGLRLVKRTVNFDDPETYHFYFGDEVGTPGSILTFFPWPGARRGRQGTGQVAVTAFSVLPGALGFWLERFVRHGIEHEGPRRRGPDGAESEQVISFRDHDGLMLEIVAHAGAEERPAWGDAPGITRDHAIHGFHGVTLWVESRDATERVLVDTLGFRPVREDESTFRYAVGGGGPSRVVDVRAVGGFLRGAGGAGTVHHVAWQVADDDAELAVREGVARAGLRPTPVIDRSYFHSVYFREPGGVLFELATNPPGFAIDEPVERLGERLMLPPQYEPHRAHIEAVLPPIHLPVPAAEAQMFADVTGPEDVSGDALGFVHRYIPPSAGGELAGSTTLLLLHGTGGDEEDLLPLGRLLLPGAGMLSPRGKVLERGAPRFFRRLAEGVFDQEDLALRTEELARFVEAASRTYELERDGIVAVGFSNGANIAASLLLRRPGLLRGAVLLSPMVPFEPETVPDLAGTSVFIGAGRSDPIVPVAQVERLAALLRQGGADVTVHWEPGGHALTRSEAEAARQWIERCLTSRGGRGASPGSARAEAVAP
ncbi:MAG TPA: VOC family protein, partial [Gemmatimonadaceae bacterium]|nr:VOC family protein [Gemmatimonadaceae bacterium]